MKEAKYIQGYEPETITPQHSESFPHSSLDMLKSNVSTFNQGMILAFHSPLISAIPQSDNLSDEHP